VIQKCVNPYGTRLVHNARSLCRHFNLLVLRGIRNSGINTRRQSLNHFHGDGMGDSSIYDLLLPYLDSAEYKSSASQPTSTAYINRLTSLSLEELTTTESTSLAQSSQSLLRSIQALARRSHKSITASATSLSRLATELPSLITESNSLNHALPALESQAAAFAEKYRKSNEATNPVLKSRRDALLLSHNVDRLTNILDLPTLLSSAVSSGQPTASTPGTGTSTGSAIGSTVNYGSALDLHAHVRRLAALYPTSPLISSISTQSSREMRLLTSHLITALRAPNIKLAIAMRTIGWLRRVAPELDDQVSLQQQSRRKGIPVEQHRRRGSGAIASGPGSADGALGALFLVCRLASLNSILEALEPLRELAEQETVQREQALRSPPETTISKPAKSKRRESGPRSSIHSGQQTERYLKRYIEIFREQSFAIVSMYKSIFPAALPTPSWSAETPISSPTIASPTSPLPVRSSSSSQDGDVAKTLLPLPSPLATFPAHVTSSLFDTLRTFMPNVTDSSSRDSLLTQVLYCAGSLGRLGGDFNMMVAVLEEELAEEAARTLGEKEVDENRDEEWVKIVKKHRVHASRLELLASGVGHDRAKAIGTEG
jgi:hypothetical protein